MVAIDCELLLNAYRGGVFPMAPSRDSSELAFYDPDPRAILPLDGFRCSRSLRRDIDRSVFEVTHDRAFESVIRSCAKPRRDEDETWINVEITDAFLQLHERGAAHSVEAWRGGNLVGGLYGLHLGAVFFGESMFHRPGLGGTNASKVCLAHLVRHLDRQGFILLDVQMQSSHMQTLGAEEIPRDRFVSILRRAVEMDVEW